MPRRMVLDAGPALTIPQNTHIAVDCGDRTLAQSTQSYVLSSDASIMFSHCRFVAYPIVTLAAGATKSASIPVENSYIRIEDTCTVRSDLVDVTCSRFVAGDAMSRNSHACMHEIHAC